MKQIFQSFSSRLFLSFPLFFILGLNFVSAQTTSIFVNSTVTVSQLDSSQRARLDRLMLNPLNDSFLLINTRNLDTTQVDGMVRVSLSIFSCPNMIFSATDVDYSGEYNYYWYGTIDKEDDSACHIGTLTLMSRNGEKFGSISIDSIIYEYHELGNGVQALARHKTELIADKDCGVINDTVSTIQDSSSHKVLPCQSCEVRVLVLYTQAAENIEGNINNRIALAIAQANQAYATSLVAQRDVRVVLAGSQKINFIESLNMEADVGVLANSTAVQNLRTSYQADLVVLLTNGNYQGGFEGIIVNLGILGVRLDKAYAIVQTRAATGSRIVFSHELGHLFGALHDKDSRGTIEHGYVFKTWFLGKRYFTLMADVPAKKDRQLFFSNPYRQFKNEYTGTINRNNVAQMLRNNGCTVANFIANPFPDFNIDIVNAIVSRCATGRAEAQVQCGAAPYTYLWEKSYNGIFWTIAGNTEIITFPVSCSDYGLLWLRLTVTDAAGQTRRIIRAYRLRVTHFW